MPIHQHINHNDMRNRNLALILNFLHQNSPISRAELSSSLGINKASISTIIRELINGGIVIETGVKNGSNDVGHPAIELMINPDAGRIIGLELKPDIIKAVITDVEPKIVWRKEIIPESFSTSEEYFSIVKRAIQETCNVARSYHLPILGLGLGLPGLLDIENNKLLAAPEIGWQDVDLNSLIVGNEDIPFYTGNEAHMAALGECYFGSSKKSQTTIYLDWGLQMSGGIIINEDVVPGSLGLAGEVGHFSLNPDGSQCTCGNYGCWNIYVNQKAIFKRIQNAIINGKKSVILELCKGELDKIKFSLVLEAAFSGDEVVLNALRETGRWLGIGIANYINLFNPEFVILGGALSGAYEIVFPEILKEVELRAMSWQRESCQIKPAKYLEDGCLVGAVATVIWNLFNNPEERIRKTLKRKKRK
jgi:N-acetylglucosamine repressor